jgi:FkbM family methyltransferase
MNMQNIIWKKLHEMSGLFGRNKNDEFRDLFRDLLMSIDVEFFMEIGAHEAAFSSDLVNLMPGKDFMAYEANPFVFEKYKNSLSSSIKYVNSAVGGDRSKKTLYIPRSVPTKNGPLKLMPSNSTSSLHSRSAVNVEYDEVIVDCTTIDSIIEDNGYTTSGALWIDVEGAVGDVLFGAHRALQNNIAMIFVEVEEKSAWSSQWLASDVTEYLATKKFVPAVRDLETDWQYNQIYIHENYLSRDVLKLIESYVELLVNRIAAANLVKN